MCESDNLCFFTIDLFGGIYISAASPFLPGGSGLFFFLGLVIILAFLFWGQIIKINTLYEHLRRHQKHTKQN